METVNQHVGSPDSTMALTPHGAYRALSRRLESLAILSSHEVRALRSLAATVRHIASHHPLDGESGRSRRFEVMFSGFACRYIVSRTGRRQIIAYLVPGDFCDSHACDPEFSDHSIGTLSAATTANAPGESFASLTVRFPAIAAALRRSEIVEEATARQWLVNLGQRNAVERTSHLLCELYTRLSCVSLATSDGCALPLTQADLADALAMSTVHMNRTLMKLRRWRLASLVHYWLTLYDFEKLKEVAGFSPTYLGTTGQLRFSPMVSAARSVSRNPQAPHTLRDRCINAPEQHHTRVGPVEDPG